MRRPTRARRIEGISLRAAAHASMIARRSAIDTSGRIRNNTTCAINGADLYETYRAADIDVATIPAPAVRAAERLVGPFAAVVWVRDFHSASVRDSVLVVAAAVRVLPWLARASIACAPMASVPSTATRSFAPTAPSASSHFAAASHRRTSDADRDDRRRAASHAFEHRAASPLRSPHRATPTTFRARSTSFPRRDAFP